MTVGNIQSLSQADSATAAHFFNTPAAYGTGASLVKTPAPQSHRGPGPGPVLGAWHGLPHTANGTAAQMTAAAKSVTPDGMYVAAPGATTTADQFFTSMKAAGY